MAKKVAAIAVMPPPTPDEFEGDEEAPEAEGAPTDEMEEPETPGEEESEGSYPEFGIPDGLDLADLKPGEEKEVLCTIRKTSDSEACITQVDGIDLAGAGGAMTGPPPPPEAPPGPPPPAMMGGMAMGGPPPSPVRARAAAAGLM